MLQNPPEGHRYRQQQKDTSNKPCFSVYSNLQFLKFPNTQGNRDQDGNYINKYEQGSDPSPPVVPVTRAGHFHKQISFRQPRKRTKPRFWRFLSFGCFLLWHSIGENLAAAGSASLGRAVVAAAAAAAARDARRCGLHPRRPPGMHPVRRGGVAASPGVS